MRQNEPSTRRAFALQLEASQQPGWWELLSSASERAPRHLLACQVVSLLQETTVRSPCDNSAPLCTARRTTNFTDSRCLQNMRWVKLSKGAMQCLGECSTPPSPCNTGFLKQGRSLRGTWRSLISNCRRASCTGGGFRYWSVTLFPTRSDTTPFKTQRVLAPSVAARAFKTASSSERRLALSSSRTVSRNVNAWARVGQVRHNVFPAPTAT